MSRSKADQVLSKLLDKHRDKIASKGKPKKAKKVKTVYKKKIKIVRVIKEVEHKRFGQVRRRDGQIDLIVSSAEIRKRIVDRAKELNVSFQTVCDHVGVKFHSFRNDYLYCITPVITSRITQQGIIKVAEALGIIIKVQVNINDASTVDLSKLRQKYKKLNEKPVPDEIKLEVHDE